MTTENSRSQKWGKWLKELEEPIKISTDELIKRIEKKSNRYFFKKLDDKYLVYEDDGDETEGYCQVRRSYIIHIADCVGVVSEHELTKYERREL